MKICVLGWHYTPMSFMEQLAVVTEKHPVTVVNKNPDRPELPQGLNVIDRDPLVTLGLEFEGYNYYLRSLWDRESNVLFMHDDTICHDITVFDRIEEVNHDVAYVFRDYAEEKANGGKHGRCIFMKKKFLDLVLSEGGFWFDVENDGYTGNGKPRPLRKNGSPIDFNAAIYTFHKYLGRVRDRRIGMDVVNRVFFPELEHGLRGKWRHKERQIKRYGLGPQDC